MRVRFVGQDGSAGYRHGQVYDVAVRTDLRGARPRIVAPYPCPYGSWEAFWRNWRQEP